VIRIGCDRGLAHVPTVLVRCFTGLSSREPNPSDAADPPGDRLLVDHEAYRVGCDIDNTPALFAGSGTRSANTR
jgi:phage terminase large subunit